MILFDATRHWKIARPDAFTSINQLKSKRKSLFPPTLVKNLVLQKLNIGGKVDIIGENVPSCGENGLERKKELIPTNFG